MVCLSYCDWVIYCQWSMAAFVNTVIDYGSVAMLMYCQITFWYLIQRLFPCSFSLDKESCLTPCFIWVMTIELMCEYVCSMCSASGRRTAQLWPVCVRALTASCCFLQDRPSRCGTWRLRRCIGWAWQLFGTWHKLIFIPGCDQLQLVCQSDDCRHSCWH